MTRRIIAVFTCLLLVFAAGCDFFAVPSSTPAPSTSAVTTEAPSEAPSDSSSTSDTGATTEPTQEATTDEPTATPSPAPSPTVAPTATPNPTEGMIFPDSDTKLIPWKSLVALKADKLALARNEIYARAGYKFTTKKYADYYEKLSWYKADPSFSESNFSAIQLANIHLIRVAESAIKGLPFEISSGLKLDYDQDGDLETLTVTFPDDNHATVAMKDGSTTTLWKITGDNLIKKAYLGDISFTDSKLDLFIGEAGPSDDFSVYVAGLKHHAFLQRGNIPGNVKGGTTKKNPFYFDGKGRITTLRRMDTIGTDFFVVRYKLDSSGKLVFVPASLYNFISFNSSKYMVKAKVALQLHKTASASSPYTVSIPIGTSVQLVSTDAKKWVKIKAPGGTGWLELAGFGMLANPNISSYDAFDGIVMAD